MRIAGLPDEATTIPPKGLRHVSHSLGCILGQNTRTAIGNRGSEHPCSRCCLSGNMNRGRSSCLRPSQQHPTEEDKELPVKGGAAHAIIRAKTGWSPARTVPGGLSRRAPNTSRRCRIPALPPDKAHQLENKQQSDPDNACRDPVIDGRNPGNRRARRAKSQRWVKRIRCSGQRFPCSNSENSLF